MAASSAVGERRCRVCGCKDDRACLGGCSWVEDDLCSTCEEAIAVLAAYMDNAHDFFPGRLMKEARTRYSEDALCT
jgi:hypothetical protein